MNFNDILLTLTIIITIYCLSKSIKNTIDVLNKLDK